ncbi:hypothetical protein GCM10018780_22080 [Streptomyces lanatus]|nr:hypothetical protein GCM10018780_22080 [Streptomyces lanatus]
MDLAGHLALLGAGAPEKDRQLAFQVEEFGPVRATTGHSGPDSSSVAVAVFAHVSPCLDFPVLKVSADPRRCRSSASISQA